MVAIHSSCRGLFNSWWQLRVRTSKGLLLGARETTKLLEATEAAVNKWETGGALGHSLSSGNTQETGEEGQDR